jgi:hypothetical protein
MKKKEKKEKEKNQFFDLKVFENPQNQRFFDSELFFKKNEKKEGQPEVGY